MSADTIQYICKMFWEEIIMKTWKKAAAALLVLVLLASLLTGCAKTLNATYKSTGALGGSLTFDKDNKVTGELFGITLDGEYEIKDDEITFKYSTVLGLGTTLTKSFEKKGDSIWIDGTEFVKQ